MTTEQHPRIEKAKKIDIPRRPWTFDESNNEIRPTHFPHELDLSSPIYDVIAKRFVKQEAGWETKAAYGSPNSIAIVYENPSNIFDSDTLPSLQSFLKDTYWEAERLDYPVNLPDNEATEALEGTNLAADQVFAGFNEYRYDVWKKRFLQEDEKAKKVAYQPGLAYIILALISLDEAIDWAQRGIVNHAYDFMNNAIPLYEQKSRLQDLKTENPIPLLPSATGNS